MTRLSDLPTRYPLSTLYLAGVAVVAGAPVRWVDTPATVASLVLLAVLLALRVDAFGRDGD